jgi:uncharacterized membrane protein YfcA
VTPSDDDARARRGFALAVAGVVGVPVLVAVVAVVPQGWRKVVFVAGLAAVGAACLWGGVMARSAIGGATAHRGRAIVGTLLGFIVGVTAAVFSFWTLVSLAL